MPGSKYLRSITDFYRVYSGVNEQSKEKARNFFSKFINISEYPLSELHSTTASEMAKVLENSFRAINIAFMQEWTDFANQAEVDMFQVLNAIRIRPTHQNIMSPGFGVGGYCLTKDALLGDWAYRNLFNTEKHLHFSLQAIGTNDLMPDYTLSLIKQHVGSIAGKKIILFGVSYLNDVADTRYSPSQRFYEMCLKEGAEMTVHDPLIPFWKEKGIAVLTDINDVRSTKYDVAVFAVRHGEYLSLNEQQIFSLLSGISVIVDANDVLNEKIAQQISSRGISLIGVGKGHWK